MYELLPKNEWYDYLNTLAIAGATMDRLVQNAYKKNQKEESIRKFMKIRTYIINSILKEKLSC